MPSRRTPPAAADPPPPSGTEPSGTEPSGTEPSGAEPSGTGPSGTGPSGAEPGPSAARVLLRVEEIPPGFVRSYGDVSPGAPRFAGTVLSRWGDRVAWHRVVRADGSLVKGDRQRARLQDEGVPFRGARVDMRAARMPD